MKIERISAFSYENKGGNPAGVVLTDDLLSDEEMLKIAKDVNYSETVFLTQENDLFLTKYFSPEMEIDFCGHATIASGRVLGEKFGSGIYKLKINNGIINLDVKLEKEKIISSFSSLQTSTKDIDIDVKKQLLEIFNLDEDDLNPSFPIRVSNSGNLHPIIFLNREKKLAQMNYDFEKAKDFMRKHQFVTISLIFFKSEDLFYSRNAFAYGGVYEDPATGSAAVALAEYLRDLKFKESGTIEILQGFDMNQPSKLIVNYTDKANSSINVSGETRLIKN
ncbi:PhzF family phenazine biosynthesis protein [Arcobacter arenosus]|uniref:PhzF family phenazine biosynthesis protein n=1 Tax=Arcobacter arenosus TaxID=2576037 RepID=A0A5R8XX13_9BACT|nr:PhzF family phenazine biosynthesis protein [Arcobacter arenosus]TLP35180.1 PhzF family phenazine biosynthesis protein [Arcobacter arenosus]